MVDSGSQTRDKPTKGDYPRPMTQVKVIVDNIVEDGVKDADVNHDDVTTKVKHVGSDMSMSSQHPGERRHIDLFCFLSVKSCTLKGRSFYG